MYSPCSDYYLKSRLGALFASCPVDEYPGAAVERVTDSSRYYALRLVHQSGRRLEHHTMIVCLSLSLCAGKHAFIGLGFADRSESFDFNVALSDFFKFVVLW